jgi:hypothetical protein
MTQLIPGYKDSNWLFKNYPDQDLSATNFYDASSTALITSTVYRLALMWGVHTHLPLAEKSRKALSGLSSNASSSNPTTISDSQTDISAVSTATNSTVSDPTHTLSAASSTSTAPSPSATPDSPGPLQHFTTNGWLTPVVNPYDFGVQGPASPEGEAFVLEMTAAWKDWVAAGSPGANGCLKMSVGWTWTVILGSSVILQWAL